MTYDWLDTLRKEELPGLITYIHTTRPEKKKKTQNSVHTHNQRIYAQLSNSIAQYEFVPTLVIHAHATGTPCPGEKTLSKYGSARQVQRRPIPHPARYTKRARQRLRGGCGVVALVRAELQPVVVAKCAVSIALTRAKLQPIVAAKPAVLFAGLSRKNGKTFRLGRRPPGEGR